MPKEQLNQRGRSPLLDLPPEVLIKEIMGFLDTTSLTHLAHSSFHLWSLSQFSILPFALFSNILKKEEALEMLMKQLEKIKEEYAFDLKKNGCCWFAGISSYAFFAAFNITLHAHLIMGVVDLIKNGIGENAGTLLQVFFQGAFSVGIDLAFYYGTKTLLNEGFFNPRKTQKELQRQKELRESIENTTPEEAVKQFYTGKIASLANKHTQFSELSRDPRLTLFWIARHEVIVGKETWLQQEPLRVRIEEVGINDDEVEIPLLTEEDAADYDTFSM